MQQFRFLPHLQTYQYPFLTGLPENDETLYDTITPIQYNYGLKYADRGVWPS
jgi:hypothetical protein